MQKSGVPAQRQPRVLVTRSARQSSALANRLRDLGVEPVLIPTIEVVDPVSFGVLDEALATLHCFDWLLFTSGNAVDAFQKRLAQMNRSFASGGVRPRIAAIGQMTARGLAEIGIPCDLLPAQAVAESFAQALLPHARHADGSATRFLLVRAQEAREHLPDTLRAAGADVTIAPAYRTVVPESYVERLRTLFSARDNEERGGPRLDAVTFTSASTVRNLLAMLDAARCTLPATIVRASIGPVTSAALSDAGIPAHVEAREATVTALAEAVVQYLTRSH